MAKSTDLSGDLGTCIGKNPKGIWSINVADLAGSHGAPDGQANSITVNNCYDSGGAFAWLPIGMAVWGR